MNDKNKDKRVKSFPRGKSGEIKSSKISKDDVLKVVSRQSEYIESLEDSLNQKKMLTKEDIVEVENLKRVLENLKKYEAEDKVSKLGLYKNIVKLKELNKIKNFMEENGLDEYDPSIDVDISDIEELQ